MTQDGIVAMAKEAGLCTYAKPPEEAIAIWTRFAELVAKQRTLECEDICEYIWKERGVKFYGTPGLKGSAKECAAAIRAINEERY